MSLTLIWQEQENVKDLLKTSKFDETKMRKILTKGDHIDGAWRG